MIIEYCVPVGQDVQLIVSPIKYKTVCGEVNALRFFEYILNPKEDTLTYIRKNEALDLAHRLTHTSSKDQRLIVTQLQKLLGNEKWLFGSAPSVADAVVWSALIKLKTVPLPTTLKNYLTSCSNFIGM